MVLLPRPVLPAVSVVVVVIIRSSSALVLGPIRALAGLQIWQNVLAIHRKAVSLVVPSALPVALRMEGRKPIASIVSPVVAPVTASAVASSLVLARTGGRVPVLSLLIVRGLPGLLIVSGSERVLPSQVGILPT